MPRMKTLDITDVRGTAFVIYVRRSYRKSGSPDVSDEVQVEVARSVIPTGAAVTIISDSGGHHSGRSDDRDGYQELISLVRSGRVDGIAVYDLSRLARKASLMLNLKDELERRNIPLLIGVMPNTRFDTAIGRFMFGQLALAAQLQADLDSERMVSLTRSIYEAGGHRGSDPFGYRTTRVGDRRELVIEPTEAEVVTSIFRDLAHSSYAAIAERLAATSTRRGRPWTEDAVKDISRRARFYLGNVVFRRGLEERPGRHEPILDETIYRDAVAGLTSRRQGHLRRAPSRRTYTLAGVIACECGMKMRGATRTSRGQEWGYYYCPAKHGSVRKDEADGVVLDTIAAGHLPDRAIEAAREELRRRLNAPRGTTTDMRDRLKNRMDRLALRFEWGELEPDEYRSRRAEIERQIAVLPDSSKLVAFDRFRKVAGSFATAINDASPERRAELVRLLVERVTVHGRTVTPTDIQWSPPARAFFEPCVTMAPPEGIRGRVATQAEDPLAWWAS